MREQPVDGAIEIAAIRPDDARDIGDDRGRNLESLMHQLGGGYACLENFDPQRLVEPANFDAEPAGQPRPDSVFETFEITRRPIGRDHDLPAGIDQGIQRMTELLLDRLALKKLNVVDHEDIYRPKTFLESDRCLCLEGGDETIHEPLRGEIDDPPPCRGGGMRDGLEKMGLPQSDRGMEIERIVVQWVRWPRGSDPLRLRCRELIGPADEEIRENQAPVQRRASGRIALARLRQSRSSRG